MTDELKEDFPVDLARIRDLASGRDEWFAMGREEKSYFINFGDEWNAVRWMDDQKKRMSEWVEREGVHLVKQHVFSELEELANAAANEIETLRAILQAATRSKATFFEVGTTERGSAINAAMQHADQTSFTRGSFQWCSVYADAVLQAATRDTSSTDAFAEYRRGVREAFNHANVIRANPHGRNADETLTYIMRTLAELANGDSAPKGDGND